MSSDIFELNCPFCDKLYKLPRDKVVKHVGKMIHCRRCGKPFSIPAIPPDDVAEEAATEAPAVVDHVESAQVESVPAEPAPVEPAPIEPAPVEPAPVEQAATAEPAPIEHSPIKHSPIEQAPVEEPAGDEPAGQEPAGQPSNAQSIAEETHAHDYVTLQSSWVEPTSTASGALSVEEPAVNEAPAVEPQAHVFADHSPLAMEDSIARTHPEQEPDYHSEHANSADVATDDSSRRLDESLSAPDFESHPEETSEVSDETPIEVSDRTIGEEPAPSSDKSPETDSHFREGLQEEMLSTVSDESAAHDSQEPVSEISLEPEPATAPEALTAIDLNDTAMAGEAIETPGSSAEPGEAASIETLPSRLPPAPLIAPPTPAAPKPRQRARMMVAPVFDAEPEETKPRRRGRLVEDAEAIEPVESIDRIAADPAHEAGDSPTAESSVAKTSIVDSPIAEADSLDSPAARPASNAQAFSNEQNERQEEIAASEPNTDAIISALSPSLKKGGETAVEERATLMPIPDQFIQDLSAIRRFVALLAVMSVVVALVLVTMLLAILGILPKK